MGIGETHYYQEQHRTNEKELHRAKITLNIILKFMDEKTNLNAEDAHDIRRYINETKSFLDKIEL